MKVAIVGAGVSGLVAAHLLHRRHEITVFEAGPRAGGHANTVRVDTAARSYDIDTGFIVFNDRNYPVFERVLGELRVASQPSDMGFSVSDERGDFEYNGSSPNGLFAKRDHLVRPWFHRMVADLVRFNRAARRLLDERRAEDLSLRDFLRRGGYSRPFVDKLIVPQVAAVWSADPDLMDTFPARFLAEFLRNHGMLGFRDRPRWRTVSGGSRAYVEAIVAPWRDRLRLSTPVTAIERAADHVTVTPRGGDPERFDHVVIGAHSDQALAMLADPTDREHELLGSVAYQPNEAVLHTDAGLLPRRRRAWASWNYHLLDDPPPVPTLTYHLNRLQDIRGADREFCVTLNRSDAIAPDKIVRKIDYAHPVYTAEGVANQARHAEISGRNRTHYCGAYWGWGFHEDGAASGVRVARALGARW
jgi:uncharacterized protein